MTCVAPDGGAEEGEAGGGDAQTVQEAGGAADRPAPEGVRDQAATDPGRHWRHLSFWPGVSLLRDFADFRER